MKMDSRWILVPLLGIGAFLILTEKNHEESSPNPSAGKEAYYLKFNKDEFFKNVIATEGHFRNVEESGIDRKGFLNCCVKHLADAESHLDEAVSHSLIVENEEASDKFRELRNKTRDFRHDLQEGRISPEEGIRRVRQIRREFESFNKDYDISECEACQVHVEIIKPQGGKTVSTVHNHPKLRKIGVG
jgi:hypothetical protein